jgi:hypothetical protein
VEPRGGSITDLSSNSSPSYFNFDSFSEIQVTNGGGDVTVQSSVCRSTCDQERQQRVQGLRGGAPTRTTRHRGNNVTKELFDAGSNGFLSGNPIKYIAVYSAEYGGPDPQNKLWFWGAADKQDINAGVVNFFDPGGGQFCQT